MKIAIVGSNGRMGRAICGKLKDKYEIIEIDKGDSLNKCEDADLLIDFSTGKNSAETATWCLKNKKKLIIGATGQSQNDIKKIMTASKGIPIVMAGNFSLGIARVKASLNKFIDDKLESVAIFEKHHKNKIDRPSGTAIELKEKILELTNKDVEMFSLRGGDEIGTHEISFYYEGEVVKITHQAFSRNVFVKGVEYAVEFLCGCEEVGLYEFNKL